MFHLRRIPRSIVACTRWNSSQVNPLVSTDVDNEGIATLQMQRLPVNSLNLELFQAIKDSVIEVEKNKCKGLVFTSASPTIFSAGIDLNELHKPDVKRLTKMKETLFDSFLKMFGSDIITTVAINGYTAAGAFILALAFEYRVMTTGKAVMGLNDTAVGIPPGPWLGELLTRIVGPRHAEFALTSSYMYSAEKALQVGLVDEVAADKADAIEKCKAYIRLYDQIPVAARVNTKRNFRQDYVTELEQNKKQYTTNFVNTISSAEVQKVMDIYMDNLKKKKLAKANKAA
ncbi:enoyl-CoA delta isomerase 1, mitochondrial-like [Spodoptera frugiperda]|uniref:Enoyl-CoA delta isomerase 1, mitochondrial-like n=1 Tax=Spodoptera frugiperda TaxID=7108 RepID=A0A9R0DLE4_SPOFR|nr:enoyl-CoA delta isomerase 1, mitochondrial-like [Spodoptera frugiperda]